MVFVFTFPVSQSSATGGSGNLGVYVGQSVVNNNNSTSTNKAIVGNIPIGFTFTGNKSVAGAYTFTVSNMTIPTICNVWKNGAFLTTTPVISSTTSAVTTKAFDNSSGTGLFLLNSYFFNLQFAYVPSTPSSTDTYTFYIPMTYTLNSTGSVSSATNSFIYGLTVATTTTSSFTNIVYNTTYTDTIGWSAYTLASNVNTNNVWNSGSSSGHVPTYPISSWNGYQECDIIYCNNEFIANNMNLKYCQNPNAVQWIDNDNNGGGVIGSISTSILTESMNFITSLTNAFNFNNLINCTGLSLLNGSTVNATIATNTGTNTLNINTGLVNGVNISTALTTSSLSTGTISSGAITSTGSSSFGSITCNNLTSNTNINANGSLNVNDQIVINSDSPSGSKTYTASTLPVIIICNGFGGGNINIPSASSMATGTLLTVVSSDTSSATYNINPNTGHIRYAINTWPSTGVTVNNVTTISFQDGQCVRMIAISGNVWMVI